MQKTAQTHHMHGWQAYQTLGIQRAWCTGARVGAVQHMSSTPAGNGDIHVALSALPIAIGFAANAGVARELCDAQLRKGLSRCRRRQKIHFGLSASLLQMRKHAGQVDKVRFAPQSSFEQRWTSRLAGAVWHTLPPNPSAWLSYVVPN